MSGFQGAWPSARTASLPRNISLETLAEIDLPHPDSITARCLVTEATGVEDPSPSFIRDLFVQISQQTAAAAKKNGIFQEQRFAAQRSIPPFLEVVVEQYQPGVNDFMTGAVSPAHQPLRAPAELASLIRDDNDSTVCNEALDYMNMSMPKMIFDRDGFSRLDLLDLPQNIGSLPEDFHITMAGIRVAFLEIFGTGGQRAYEDGELIAQLLMLGGKPRKPKIMILYPEDLVPIESGENWGELHRQYWKELRDMAEERPRWEEESGEQNI